jgi:ribose 5-phosphate isomerase B
MKIYLGADHNGFLLKSQIADYLCRNNYDVVDEGDTKLDPNDDFPQFAARVVAALKTSDDQDAKGILICGSGQGMCMTANRYKGIRASLVWNEDEARMSRNDDDANILCLPAKVVKEADVERIIRVWLTTGFAGASRFKRRIKEMDELL